MAIWVKGLGRHGFVVFGAAGADQPNTEANCDSKCRDKPTGVAQKACDCSEVVAKCVTETDINRDSDDFACDAPDCKAHPCKLGQATDIVNVGAQWGHKPARKNTDDPPHLIMKICPLVRSAARLGLRASQSVMRSPDRRAI